MSEHKSNNQNELLLTSGLTVNDNLRSTLPREIQLAITEWANSLNSMPWKIKRRAITRFSGSFADNFLAIVPNLSDEEYQSLSVLGTTCLLEELDDGNPITNEEQAKCYLESIHAHHQAMAEAFIATKKKQNLVIH